MSRVVSSLALLACVAAFGCSAKHGSSSSPSTGGGSSSSSNEGPQAATEKGSIVDFSTKKPVAGAKVTAGDQTTTTASDGSFSFTVQKGEKFHFTVEKDGYAKLFEQETTLDGDFDRGPTTLVPQSMATLLTGMLAGYDASLGVLGVQLIPTGGCASEAGATVKVSPEGGAKVAYFASGLPNASLTSAKAGEQVSAIVYNVQPGVDLTVTVEHASCTEAPFPVVQGTVSYTGAISTEPGETTSFARVFLQ